MEDKKSNFNVIKYLNLIKNFNNYNIYDEIKLQLIKHFIF